MRQPCNAGGGLGEQCPEGSIYGHVTAIKQNGRRDVTKPVMRAVKCKKRRVKRHGRHHKMRAHRRSRR